MDEKIDSLTRANQERAKQGSCEVEISYGAELDLHRSLILCQKNPGHKKFIPIDKFNIDHLPSLYHNEDVVDAVRALADITVRLKVKCVSDKRPKTFPGSNKPYPCYSDSGDDMMRVGTGWLERVDLHSSKYTRKIPCACNECVNSSTPKTEFARIVIKTAAHVIYDTLEGQQTTCLLFFDRGDSPESCAGALELSGMSEVVSDSENDSSEIRYFTHDPGLVEKLNNLWCRYKETHLKVGRTYTEIYESMPEKSSDPDKCLTIIVSHPHGCSKQVSIGHFTSRNIVDIYSQFVYTTATCSGSSGAPVYVVQRLFLGCSNPHYGNYDDNNELNCSALVEF